MSEAIADFAARRAAFHATYNGGWHGNEDGMRAFHHGMDTVFNALDVWVAAGAGESTQGGDVGPVVPAPWQVERVGEAWRAVYDRAHDVTAAWLMTEHATPGLTEKLQALSVALMTLDQRRLATFAPSDGDMFTWKARAEKAEAQLAAADRVGAGDRPPVPSEVPFPLEEIERRIESLLANEDLSVTGRGLLEHIRQFAWQLGAVRPTPCAVLTVETLADWIWDAAARTSGSHVTISRTGCEVLATRLLPRLGAASPAAPQP